MRRSFGLLLVVSMVGCGSGGPFSPRSPQVGDVVTLAAGYTRLYLDENTFKADAELAEAGSEKRNEDFLSEKWLPLGQATKVRILQTHPSGPKVVVEEAMGYSESPSDPGKAVLMPQARKNGKIGWIIAKELKAAPAGTPK